MSQRILVVEDEGHLADGLRYNLEAEGYDVDCVETGEEALTHLNQTPRHDAIILDIMLPGIDGFAVLSALRTSKSIPVLLLTARGQTNDKVRGFDLGADDYLVKPFQFPELLARVRALLKRSKGQPSDTVLKIADLEVDPIRHRAIRSGKRFDLTAKEFALLTLLLQRSGEVLSRTQIASLVWDINFDSDTNVVEVAIRRLRAKVDDDFAEKLIHTVRGVGYVLEHRETM